MKKTLITLMALAGVAMAQDYTTETLWTAEFGSQYGESGYTTTLTKPGKFWDADKLATENGAQTKSDGRIHAADGTYGDWADDFELAITLTFTGDSFTAGHISEVKAGGTGDWVCLAITGEGVLSFAGNKVDTSAITSTGAVELGTEYTLTFTKIGQVLTLTAGDASATTTLTGTLSGTINNITLGGNTGAGNRVPVLVESMAMSSVTVVAAPSTPSVPEPATATLSLLALAGLAARRRRK